jgi:serine/threonine protein kinase
MVPPPDDTPESLDGQVTSDGEPDRPIEKSLGEGETAGNDPSTDSAGTDFDENWTPPEMLADRYRLEEKIGQGGMGVVYRAHDTNLNITIAVKLISGGTIERFRTEAQSIAALNHPGIVRVYEFNQQDDLHYIVMEHVEGESLAQRLAQGTISVEEALRITASLCDALSHAHGKGIIHRDIKPSNVLLSDEGVPKLVDFGLARIESDQGQHTRAGAVLGTLDFMPPEQKVDATKTDARSDLWSLGATLYQVVTGEVPRVIDLDEVPGTIRSVLARALKSKPEARFQTAEEFREALRDVRPDSTPATSEGTLAEGECPSCGTTNDSRRKFCKGCGAALKVACLSCEQSIPVWERFCGECGADQANLLLEQRRSSMQKQRDEAEVLSSVYEYEKARALVEQIRSEPDERLQPLQDWATGFLESLASEESEQQERVAGLLGQVEQHRASYDYASAVQTLERIPEPLRTPEMQDLLVEVERSKAESEQLLATIRERIGNKDLEGLLGQVTRALELLPDREDLQKIKGQLKKRGLEKAAEAESLREHKERRRQRRQAQAGGDIGDQDTDYNIEFG